MVFIYTVLNINVGAASRCGSGQNITDSDLGAIMPLILAKNFLRRPFRFKENNNNKKLIVPLKKSAVNYAKDK
jgi:hypothetical protein